MGDNILGITIQSTTINNYLTASAKLYVNKNLPDPYKCPTLKINFPKKLLAALARYEKVKRRREIITDRMFIYIEELAKVADEDSLIAAVKDWLAFSRYSAIRRSEWCQTTKTKYEKPLDGPDEALAFIFSDFEFYDVFEHNLDVQTATYADVAFSSSLWRFQKNGDNGEKRRYFRDDANPSWCCVLAQWRIAKRARRLNIPAEQPIAKYRDTNGKIYFIRDTDVANILRQAAREVHGITDPEKLALWSCHSCRVTPCNELHRLGFSDVFLKHRFRWRSDAYMDYLRDTIHAARQHTQAMRLLEENITLTPSNLQEVNERRAEDNLHDERVRMRTFTSEDRILWGLSSPND